jgi:hypothetical protein
MTVARNEYFQYYADLRVAGNMPPQALGAASALTSEVACDVTAGALSAVGIKSGDLFVEEPPNSDSAISTVYSLRSEAGTRFVMRAQLPFLPDGDIYDYTGVEGLVRSTCSDAGIRTPAIYASHADMGSPPSFTFTVEENSGRDGWRWLASHPESASSFIDYVAGCLVTMHSVVINRGGYGFFDRDEAKRGFLQGSQPEDYRAYINATLPRALGQLCSHGLLSDSEAGGIAEFFQTDPCIDDVERQPIVLLHGDPGYHNTLVDSDCMPSTLIDFGESQAGPAIRDIAGAFRPLAFLPVTRNQWPAFLEAYQAKGGVLPENAEKILGALILRIDIAQLAAGVTVLQHLQPPTRELSEKNLGETRERIAGDAIRLGIRHFSP